MSKKSYSKEMLQEAVCNSVSVAQVLVKLGLMPAGGNYQVFNRNIVCWGIDTSHFLGLGHMRGKINTHTKKTPIEKILVENSTYTNSNVLKKRLIMEGYFKHICSACRNTEWLGKSIPLELEHINGIRSDNRRENITLLCPNCHAFTSTYRRRKIRLIKRVCKLCEKSLGRTAYDTCFICRQKTKQSTCSHCGKLLKTTYKTGLCPTCSGINLRGVNRPSKDELERLVWETATSKIAKQYGVSDVAVAKWCKGYGINKPPRGYWSKQARVK